MRVSIVGSGYVGLVSGAGLSEVGHHVVCMDIDEARISGLKNGIVPIFEPGLKKMLSTNAGDGRLEFTTSISRAVEHAEVLFIAVGTPPDEDGSADQRLTVPVTRTEQVVEIVVPTEMTAGNPEVLAIEWD